MTDSSDNGDGWVLGLLCVEWSGAGSNLAIHLDLHRTRPGTVVLFATTAGFICLYGLAWHSSAPVAVAKPDLPTESSLIGRFNIGSWYALWMGFVDQWHVIYKKQWIQDGVYRRPGNCDGFNSPLPVLVGNNIIRLIDQTYHNNIMVSTCSLTLSCMHSH